MSDIYSFVQPGADYTRIKPIDQKLTVTFLNEYVINTVAFLNEFTSSSVQKLLKVNRRLEHLNTLVKLLDSKLNYMNDGFAANESNAPQANASTTSAAVPNPPSVPLPNDPQSVQRNTEVETIGDASGSSSESEDEVEEAGPVLDAAYLPFLKQLKFGAHPMAVRLAITNAGLDPDAVTTDDGTLVIDVKSVLASFAAASA